MDAAIDRIERRARSDFEHAVEANRLATIFAHKPNLYRRWLRKRKKGPIGLSGLALEHAVSGLAMTNPEYVVRGSAT